MNTGLKRLALVFCVMLLPIVVLATTASGLINSSKTVATNGRISTVNVGVYTNSGCTQAVTSLDWGNLTAGSSTTFTVWVKNIGSAKETLSMTTNGWSPSIASQYISLSWNQNNTVLTPNQVVNATLTLTVSPTISTSITTFGNNITITGTG
jgi:hypothetical protein